MKKMFAIVLALGFVCTSFSDEAKPVARLLEAPKVSAEGKPTDPKIIATEEDFKKVLPGYKAEIDFKKEKLVLFTWSGSGGDKINPTGDTKKVTFNYSGGLTFDLREHVKLFAVPKDAEVKVVTLKP